MVLVGTNRVLSTPSIFAAFSCSSEMGVGKNQQLLRPLYPGTVLCVLVTGYDNTVL